VTDPGKRPQSAELVDLADMAFELLLGPDGEPFAIEIGGPNLVLPFRGKNGLRQGLASLYRANHGRPPSGNAVSDALAVLEGQAQDKPRRAVHLRAARHDGGVVLDLGDPDGRAVVVQPGRWEVVDRSPVLFRRTALIGPMPTPVAGGNAERLAELVNIPASSWPLLLAWKLAAWLPDLPAPILLLAGEQGTGKSTAARLFVDTVDPGPAPLRTAPATSSPGSPPPPPRASSPSTTCPASNPGSPTPCAGRSPATASSDEPSTRTTTSPC
jgi:hypothetical protein